ncbi:hypothetical protein N800_12170 [Lysobacter daejeonensis GH1-9]|uniref:YdhG-like domain-containing protein n=1 Tax=Lysobacter daejeonensis GH1-9 TaxID=1385517 RepID=A0A0A0EZB2_9GAMM|nr:YdeI/OmpD-associated family protein [Lysobacter daejeonensis]KGM55849.1 hypothetical protein N800_12170 [Lysobacter daejeonensis GH1-9]
MATPDPRIDAYIARSAPFARPILAYLRDVMGGACPEGEEALKWGSPHLTYKGKLVCGMAAFKQHATFGFWQGGKVLGAAAGRAEAAMGQFGRLTEVSQLPPREVLEDYVRRAMRLIDEGATRKPAKASPRPALPVPEDLVRALAAMPAAQETFDAFPPSQRREYIEWITEAKRNDTRQRRLAQAVEWMAEGKPRNWKYMNC